MRSTGLLNLVAAGSIGLVLGAQADAAEAQDSAKKAISTPDAPKAVGPYSQAIAAGKTLYLAGQVAIDPKTNQFMTDASSRIRRGASLTI